MTIAKDPPQLQTLTFDVTVALTITNNDTGKERKLTFTKNQIILDKRAKTLPWW